MGYDSASPSQDGRDEGKCLQSKLGNCSMGSGSEHVFVRLFWLYAIISGARIGSRIEMFYDSMSDGFEMIDDEEEYEESGKGNRFLGFMFGNVDNSGDLDVDYLDEDAKEHLSALADKLGPSLTDIDLSGKSPQTPPDLVEQGEVCQEKTISCSF
ncbi:hypothetical protein LR48_Vigan10g252700 [Vigna angularis]|uniref:TAFII-230 TBP-binding domain-containing protein n=1 Tax=Phaseolus angularis TaxID=3914 RepID=A0A0L9VNJ4_PHAAN|nr:hypothetical protein LR48_Vigan10g252700 [Vigna angularis]